MKLDARSATRRYAFAVAVILSVAVQGRSSVAMASPRISLSPTSSSTVGGASVDVEVYIEDVTDLRLYEVVLRVTGGVAGTLDLTNVAIDDTRGDFVFAGLSPLVCLPDSNGQRIMCTPFSDDCVTITDAPAYLCTFTFTFTASVDASGIFDVGIVSEPISFLRDCDSGAITPFTIASAQVDADCNDNGISDICDTDCDAMGGTCSVPHCGQSLDCNDNSVPDECDTVDSGDFDANGVADLHDFGSLAMSLGGPAQPLNDDVLPECAGLYLSAFDVDSDHDVDLFEVSEWIASTTVVDQRGVEPVVSRNPNMPQENGLTASWTSIATRLGEATTARRALGALPKNSIVPEGMARAPRIEGEAGLREALGLLRTVGRPAAPEDIIGTHAADWP